MTNAVHRKKHTRETLYLKLKPSVSHVSFPQCQAVSVPRAYGWYIFAWIAEIGDHLRETIHGCFQE